MFVKYDPTTIPKVVYRNGNVIPHFGSTLIVVWAKIHDQSLKESPSRKACYSYRNSCSASIIRTRYLLQNYAELRFSKSIAITYTRQWKMEIN